MIISADEIHRKIEAMGCQISNDYKDRYPLMVGILKGCFIFAADLLRTLNFHYELDFLGTSSYGNDTASSGIVRLTKDLDVNVEGRHVLLLEDIVDTGLTLHYLCDILQRRNPASLKIAALIEKEIPRNVDLPVEYIGFKTPDIYLAGFGLDWKQLFRGLPYVAEVIEH